MRHETGVCSYDAVVLDIEGTTTPLAFVRDVLFPCANAARVPARVLSSGGC